MSRRGLSVAVALLLLGTTGAAAALADGPSGTPTGGPSGGTAVDQCYAHASSQVDDSGYKLCRSMQAAEWVAAAACRMPERSAGATDRCGAVDGRTVDEAQVAAYENSWVHRALTLQRGLAVDAPLWEAQFPHTHNSFNSSAYAVPTDGSAPSYYPTLTNQDPNQVYSITDQLRMDIRAIEIDLHWVPSPYGTPQTHGYWPTMCHGDAQQPGDGGPYVHVGCTDDRPMQDGLAELRRWLDANPDQFVLLYLENQLFPGEAGASQQQAHDVAAHIVDQQLGSLVYTPPSGLPAGTCAPMPYDETQADMLAQGKRVLIVGNCGPGAWNQWVFTRGPAWDESGDPTTYGAKDCAADEAAREQHTSFRRWYEESPWLEAMTDATQVLTPQTTAAMVRCGVNLVGFDQLQPFDGRLAAFVWSWADGEPSSGGTCAVQGGDTRFHAAACGRRHPFACVDANLDWHVTAGIGRWTDGRRVCEQEFPGSTFAVPPNGYRNAQLTAAKHGDDTVWLDYAVVGGHWRPDALVDPPPPGDNHGRGHAYGHAYGHGTSHGRGHHRAP